MAYWQAPLAPVPKPARVRGGNWGHKCGLLPQSMLNPFCPPLYSYNATGHGGVLLGLWLALIGSFFEVTGGSTRMADVDLDFFSTRVPS